MMYEYICISKNSIGTAFRASGLHVYKDITVQLTQENNKYLVRNLLPRLSLCMTNNGGQYIYYINKHHSQIRYGYRKRFLRN